MSIYKRGYSFHMKRWKVCVFCFKLSTKRTFFFHRKSAWISTVSCNEWKNNVWKIGPHINSMFQWICKHLIKRKHAGIFISIAWMLVWSIIYSSANDRYTLVHIEKERQNVTLNLSGFGLSSVKISSIRVSFHRI